MTSPLVPCDIFHPSLLMAIKINNCKPIEFNLCTYDFYTCNYSAIIECLGSINWLQMFENLDINDVTNLFYYILSETIDLFGPKKSNLVKKYPLWFSLALKNLIFKKKIAHKIFKSSGSLNDYNTFSKLNYINHIKTFRNN